MLPRWRRPTGDEEEKAEKVEHQLRRRRTRNSVLVENIEKCGGGFGRDRVRSEREWRRRRRIGEEEVETRLKFDALARVGMSCMYIRSVANNKHIPLFACVCVFWCA
jgi:hypothetical protein